MKQFSSHFGLQISSAIIPSLMILLAVPILTIKVNTNTFAAFSIVISMIGFLSVLDGGIGRATTFFVRKTLLQKCNASTNTIVNACILIGFSFSILVMFAMLILLDTINGPTMILARDALRMLLFFTPVIVTGSVMKGVLEGQQKFAISSFLQLFQGLVVGITPIIIVNNLEDLKVFSFIVGVVRVLLLALQIHFSSVKIFANLQHIKPSLQLVLNYSKWLFISNLVGLTIVFADRLLVASTFDHHVVSAYMLPMEMIARSMIIVSAFASVLFPRLVDYATLNHLDFLFIIDSLKSIIVKLTLAVSFIMLPFVDLLLIWWIGPETAVNSRVIVVVGLIGVAISSSATIYMIGINSLGHTRQIAILHVLELPFFLGLLYFAAKTNSLLLVQIAWIARLIIDNFGLYLILNYIKNKPSTPLQSFLCQSKITFKNLFSKISIFTLMFVLISLAQLDAVYSRITILFICLPIALFTLLSAFRNSLEIKDVFSKTLDHKMKEP